MTREVQVHWFVYPVDRDPDAATLARLSEAERARLLCIPARARVREFAAGRGAVRGLLARVLGMAPDVVPIVETSTGALRVEGSEWTVSLSHAPGVIAVALARGLPLGIDVERDGGASVAGCALRATGIGNDSRARSGPEAALREWTRLEALGKALGIGIRAFCRSAPAPDVRGFEFHPLFAMPGCTGTVAVAGHVTVREHPAAARAERSAP